jgi:hypothetical protein
MIRNARWAALLAAALLAPGALAAQDRREQARAEEEAARARQERGWLGIAFAWDEEDGAAGEARVSDVVEGSGAERAGIRAGDVVLRIDGEPATEETVEALGTRLRPGTQVRLRIRRDGRESDVDVTAGERPGADVFIYRDQAVPFADLREKIVLRDDDFRVHLDSLRFHMDSLRSKVRVLHSDSLLRLELDRMNLDDVVVLRMDSVLAAIPDSIRLHLDRELRELPMRLRELEKMPDFDIDIDIEDLEPGVPFMMELGRRSLAGAELAPMNEGLARYFRVDEGVLVIQVGPETPAARAGLEAGDVIVQAGGEAVESVADLRRAISRAEGSLQVEVMREGRRRTLTVEVPRMPDVREFRPRVRARTRVDGERDRVRQEREKTREPSSAES